MFCKILILSASIALVSTPVISATLFASLDGIDTVSIEFNDTGNGILDFDEFVSWDHLTAGSSSGEVISPFLGSIGSGSSVSDFASAGSIAGWYCDGQSDDFCFQNEAGTDRYRFTDYVYRIEGISNNDPSPSPVPLPASALLLGSALLGSICVGRRRRSKVV